MSPELNGAAAYESDMLDALIPEKDIESDMQQYMYVLDTDFRFSKSCCLRFFARRPRIVRHLELRLRETEICPSTHHQLIDL